MCVCACVRAHKKLIFILNYFIENHKGSSTENRYPLRSKSKISCNKSTRTDDNITNELTNQEAEPSPNKRPKLELPTLGKFIFCVLLKFNMYLTLDFLYKYFYFIF